MYNLCAKKFSFYLYLKNNFIINISKIIFINDDDELAL